MTTLQIVSPVDETTVLYDLNDSTGVYSGLYGGATTKLVTQFDLGVPRLQSSTVDPQDLDVSYPSFAKRATASMKGKVVISASTYDNLVLAQGTLANYLTQGCVMKWSEGTATYLVDVLPSDTPALIAGQELAIYEVGALFKTTIDLSLERQPYLRQSALTASVNILNNATLLRDSNQDGTPDSWNISSTPTLSISATQQALHVVAGGGNQGIEHLTGSGSASVGQTWTLSGEFKITSGTAGLRLLWFTSGTVFISEVTRVSTTSTKWVRLSITGTAPATTSQMRVDAASDGGVSTFDVRNMQLELSATATPFRVKAETVNLDPATAGISKMLPVWNPGTAPSPCVITAAFPDASSNAEALDYWLASSQNTPGKGYLSDFLNGPYYSQAEVSPSNGWSVTAGTDTTLAGVADATASPGSGTTAARITHSTDPTTYNKRLTFSRTTLLDCLRGQHRVFARVKPASASVHRLQLSWSAGGTTRETNDQFKLDTTQNTSNVWALCDLGTIELPENPAVTMASMTLELYTRMGLGLTAVNLDVDYIMLVPQDMAAHVVAANAETSQIIITEGGDLQVPKDLGAGDPTWIAGVVRGSGLRLNGLNEAGGIGSTTTGAWTGVSGGTRDVYFYLARNSFVGTVKCEVANLTDNTVTATQSFVSAVEQNGHIACTLRIVDVAGKLYQPRVVMTAWTSGGVDVYSVSSFITYAITQDQQVRTDPGSTGLDRYAAERLTSAGNYVGSLEADRVPFWLDPGLNLLWIESYDRSVGGEELPHFNARTLTVTPTVYPRFWA